MYLDARVAAISRNALDGATTGDEWRAKRPQLRRHFLDMLGLDPLPPRTDLKATVTSLHSAPSGAAASLASRTGTMAAGTSRRVPAVGISSRAAARDARVAELARRLDDPRRAGQRPAAPFRRRLAARVPEPPRGPGQQRLDLRPQLVG